MRLKAGATPGRAYSALCLLAYGEAREPTNHDVLTGRGRQLVAQLLDGLAVELGVVHLLLEQHDRGQPRVELARHDFLANVLGLVGGLLLVDPGLRLALLLRD